jgi:hypothetical protein
VEGDIADLPNDVDALKAALTVDAFGSAIQSAKP